MLGFGLWGWYRSELRIISDPFSACVFIHVFPVCGKVWVRRFSRGRLLFGIRGSYPRLELGISYMYWWEACHLGGLVAGVGGAACAWGLAVMYGW